MSESLAESGAKPPQPPPQPQAQRPSGLRPPSKIGRICCAGPPKPAIPPLPKANGSPTEATRKFSDDYSRKHLADVQEADEDTEGGAPQAMGERGDRTPLRERKPSTCSTYSITSMDALWENHPRRLSEAGLRRTSDHSVVLTEDTDSFIIGDRVWVGGSKPGQIAYIGDTQFAPGEWAGVVLDEPIGKNDGSVAGVRYFQCEARRGVFSRLTRLTHEPLDLPSPASPASELGGTSNGGSRPPSAPRTLASPAPRAPPSPGPRTPVSPGPRNTAARARRSASPNGSMKSFSSRMSTSTVSAELRLGERVIVSSSQGSKAGTLRFMGPTDFAQGQWCGVELDDPIGKNDGSVEGKRYFECGPRFGLFAPLSKVSRSPSSRRPGSCAVHGSRVNSPPESTASFGSMASSVVAGRPRLGVTSLAGGAQRLSGPRASSTPMSAKNTLQEILREKQQHIEKLIKEHEVERGELAKMGLQMDRTQSTLTVTQKENAQYLKEIEKLKAEYEALSRQLEDEKQKVEDLMFRAEEDNIHKEDFSRFKEELLKEKEKLISNMQSLEAELDQTKHAVDELQAQCVLMKGQHKAENEILLAQHKDEVQAAHALAAELQKLLDEAHMLLREKDGDKDSLGKNHFEELTKIKNDSEKTINELKAKLNELQLESSGQIKLLTDNLSEASNKIAAQNEKLEKMTVDNSNLVGELRSQMEQKQLALDLKVQEYNQVMASFKESELVYKKDNDKLKMEVSSKNIDNETLNENNKQLDALLKMQQIEFDKIKIELISKDLEIESLTSNNSKHNESIQSEIKLLKEDIQQKQAEIDRITSDAQETQQMNQKQLEENSNKLTLYTEEISNLKAQIELLNQENIKHTALSQGEFKNKLEIQDTQIVSLQKQLEDKNRLFEDMIKKNDGLSLEREERQSEIKNLTDTVAQKQIKLDELINNISEISTTLSALQLENGDLTRQLRDETEKNIEIQQQKDKLANEISNLSNHSTTSDEQINILTNKLRDAEKDLQNVREANREKVNNLERIEQELKQQLEQVKNQTEIDKNDLTKKLNDMENSKKECENQIQSLSAKLNEIQEKSITLLTELESKYQVIISELTTAIEAKNTNESKLKKRIEEIEIDSNKIISDLTKRLEILQENGQTSEGQLKEKLNDLFAVQNELNQKLEASQKNENQLQETHSKLLQVHEITKQTLESQLKVREEKERSLELEIKKLHDEFESSVRHVNDKDILLKDLQHKISLYELDLKSNVDIISEKDRQIDRNSEDIQKLLDEKHELEKKLNLNLSECEKNVQKINNILEENLSKDIKLKEQDITISNLKEQMESIISVKKSMESDTAQTSENLSQLKLANETLTYQVLKLENTLKQHNSEISTKTEKIALLESEINSYKNLHIAVESLKSEINQHINDIENKNIVISQLNENIKVFKKESADEYAEKERKKNLLENEIAEIKTSHLHELTELKKIIHNMDIEKTESQKRTAQLEDANAKISELKMQSEKSEADIQKLSALNDAQKKNYEQLNNQLQEEFEKIKSDGKKERKQLREQIKLYELQISENNKLLKKEEEQKKDSELKYEEANNAVKELQNRVQYLEASGEKKAGDEKTELQKVVLELQNCQKAHDEEAKLLKHEISGLLEQVAKKNIDSSKYSNHISTLENDLKKSKTQNEGLLKEIVILTKEMMDCKKTVAPSDLNSNINIPKPQPVDVDAKRLLEEKEEVEGQVNFLNSVIVDMQRKNEELKARVEVLEMGCTPQEADEFNLNGLKQRTIAPRMFCDICDIFDAHETEDCPRQMSEAETLPQQGDKRKPAPAPRPYCDICEIFGHDTENCDDEETY